MRRHLNTLALIVTFLLTAAARADTDERWFVLLLQGKKAGHAVSTRTEAEGKITSRTEMTLSIKRQADALKLSASTEFVETVQGRPVSMSSRLTLGPAPMTATYTWAGDSVEVRQNGGSPTLVPAPKGDWLTPAAAERFSAERLKAGDQEITIRTIDPSLGLEPITMKRRVTGRQPVEVLGRTVPGVRWNVEIDKPQNMKMEEFTDETGESVRSVISLGFIEIEQRLADKDLALSPVDAPELLMSTLVQMPGPIAGARGSRALTYRVSATSGDLPDLPTLGAQTFERESPTAGRLTINLDRRAPAAEDPQASLGASRMIDPRDDALQSLIDRARLDNARTTLAKVEALRDVVSRHVTAKDLSVGFGTSGETVRTRTGDCTEHAVLLAALCRRAGIPARVVSGLVYMDRIEDQQNVFGYHLWTQVLVEEGGARRWVDADATLPAGGPLSDATHIAIMASNLGDDEMQNFMVTTAPMIGRMKIEVVKP